MVKVKISIIAILNIFGCVVFFTAIIILIYVTFMGNVHDVSTKLQLYKQKPVENSKRLLDLPDFKYLLNSNVCVKNSDFITSVLLVTSLASNVETRSAIRQAYSRSELQRLGIVRVFLLAALPSSKTQNKATTISQEDLLLENERFSDLVQGNFQEAYRNLTYKHVMGLQWAVTHCGQARFIVKMDDDIAVDFYQLSKLVKSVNQTGLLMGYLLHGLKPMRERINKWFVTREEYSKSFYPPFLSGWMYVTSRIVVETLLMASQREHFFWIDDTYVTGILARRANVKQRDISARFAVHPEYLECCLDTKLACDFIAGPVGTDYGLLWRFKSHSMYCHLHNCPKRTPEKYLHKTCVSKEKLINLGRGKADIKPFDL